MVVLARRGGLGRVSTGRRRAGGPGRAGLVRTQSAFGARAGPAGGRGGSHRADGPGQPGWARAERGEAGPIAGGSAGERPVGRERDAAGGRVRQRARGRAGRMAGGRSGGQAGARRSASRACAWVGGSEPRSDPGKATHLLPPGPVSTYPSGPASTRISRRTPPRLDHFGPAPDRARRPTLPCPARPSAPDVQSQMPVDHPANRQILSDYALVTLPDLSGNIFDLAPEEQTPMTIGSPTPAISDMPLSSLSPSVFPFPGNKMKKLGAARKVWMEEGLGDSVPMAGCFITTSRIRPAIWCRWRRLAGRGCRICSTRIGPPVQRRAAPRFSSSDGPAPTLLARARPGPARPAPAAPPVPAQP